MAINERNYVGFAVSPTTGRPHRIRHLPKMASWETGVYLWEEGDKFVGGIDGIDNLPTQQLANRTEYLYAENALLKETVRQLLVVVKEAAPGRSAASGYPVTASAREPGSPCAWIRPSRGRNLPSIPVMVSREPSPKPCAWVVPKDNLGTLWDAGFLIRSDIGDMENPVCEITWEGSHAPQCVISSEDFRVPLGDAAPEKFRVYLSHMGKEESSDGGSLEDAVPVIEMEGGSFEVHSAMLRTQEGSLIHIGTKESLPRIPHVVGTMGAVLSRTDLMAGGAWVRPSEDIGQDDNLAAKVVLEDGTAIEGFTAMVLDSEDNAYYIQLFREEAEPLYDTVVDAEAYDLATRRDIDKMLAKI